MDHSPVSTMVVGVWWGDDLAWLFSNSGLGLCLKASWTLWFGFLFQRRRAQLLGLIVLLNLLSGFDFEGPASPNGSRLIDRVGNILVINFVDFLLFMTSSSPKR